MISLLRRSVLPFVFLVFTIISPGVSAEGTGRDRIEAFLTTTGFDVALESIALASASAPQMLGIDPEGFGSDWTRLTEEVFDTEDMHEIAVSILQQTLSDDALNTAVEFYASDLGQRLVVAENASHMIEDDEAKQSEGQDIISDLVQQGSSRLVALKRMNSAIDSSDAALRALQEIQVRFLLAASASGVIELRMDADELRSLMGRNEPAMRQALQISALAGAAYTYQAFSEDDINAYVEALEQPLMQEVYELLNAVQYEIMAMKFEVLATRMADLHPAQDI